MDGNSLIVNEATEREVRRHVGAFTPPLRLPPD